MVCIDRAVVTRYGSLREILKGVGEVDLSSLPFLRRKKRLVEKPKVPANQRCKVHGEYVSRYFQVPSMQGRASFWVENHKCDLCMITLDGKDGKDIAQRCVDNGILASKNTRLNAGISERYLWWSFDKFKCKTEAQEKSRDSVVGFGKGVPSKSNLLMIGNSGNGKTMLACALVDSLCDKLLCKITTLLKMIRKIKSTWDGKGGLSEQQVIDRYVMYDLLVIDEIGKQFFSKTECLFLFEVINGRYEGMKSTIIISNGTLEDVGKGLGEASMDRLDENLEVVWFGWGSLRSTISP